MKIEDIKPWPHAESMPWLKDRIIFLTKHGSHAYGTSTPTSDMDVKGVAIPPREYFTGFVKKFEQAESKDPDMVIYDVRKFFNLAADCNPSIIEILFTDESDHLMLTTTGKAMLFNRELFLSKKAKHTFSGYAISQLKRIQRHYHWLKNPPKEEPTRALFGLPEYTAIPANQRSAAMAEIRKKVDEWYGLLDFDCLVDPALAIGIRAQIERFLEEIRIGQDDIWKAAARTVGLDDNWLEILKTERAYAVARDEWRQYQNWKATRNPARSALEAKYGYDTKHAMHLVRLMRMCEEILTTGKVLVRRPDADELNAIRRGAWTYEQLIEWADKKDNELYEAYKTSKLPNTPDRAKLDSILMDIVAWDNK